MRIPGFTGENSIYRSGRRWRVASGGSGTTGSGQVIPQITFCVRFGNRVLTVDCDDWCIATDTGHGNCCDGPQEVRSCPAGSVRL
jgi:hypothetical protein